MSKEKVTLNVSQTPRPTSDREARWQKLLEQYKKENPVKYAQKEARGEFKNIPSTFV